MNAETANLWIQILIGIGGILGTAAVCYKTIITLDIRIKNLEASNKVDHDTIRNEHKVDQISNDKELARLQKDLEKMDEERSKDHDLLTEIKGTTSNILKQLELGD